MEEESIFGSFDAAGAPGAPGGLPDIGFSSFAESRSSAAEAPLLLRNENANEDKNEVDPLAIKLAAEIKGLFAKTEIVSPAVAAAAATAEVYVHLRNAHCCKLTRRRLDSVGLCIIFVYFCLKYI